MTQVSKSPKVRVITVEVELSAELGWASRWGRDEFLRLRGEAAKFVVAALGAVMKTDPGGVEAFTDLAKDRNKAKPPIGVNKDNGRVVVELTLPDTPQSPPLPAVVRLDARHSKGMVALLRLQYRDPTQTRKPGMG